MDWHPSKPTWWQIVIGLVFWVAVAALALYWSTDEAGGNRIFLWILAGLALGMAAWRVWYGIVLARQAVGAPLTHEERTDGTQTHPGL